MYDVEQAAMAQHASDKALKEVAWFKRMASEVEERLTAEIAKLTADLSRERRQRLEDAASHRTRAAGLAKDLADTNKALLRATERAEAAERHVERLSEAALAFLRAWEEESRLVEEEKAHQLRKTLKEVKK